MTASAPESPAAPFAASPAPRRTRAPSWLDLRLIVGVALVVVSVSVGARVVASSDNRVGVWQATRDLAAGAVLTEQDTRIARVRLPSTEPYVVADEPIVGVALSRPVEAGELLPRSSVTAAEEGVTLTIPVAAEDAPSVRRGQRIAVWATARSCERLLVIADVVVQEAAAPRAGALSGSSRIAITVRVPVASADRVISALSLPDSTIRIGVLSGAAPPPPPDGTDIDRCEAAR